MADYDFIESTGTIVADTSTILAEVQGEYQTAFNNSDLDTDPATPQGVLITAETIARTEAAQNNAALANQINPNIAGGTFFDAIYALTGGSRDANTQSVVNGVALTGQPFTTIAQGSGAQTAAGDLFTSTGTVVLNSAGTGTTNFQSVAYGPIPCAVGALNAISAPGVLGWETVTNANAAILGTTTESDGAARADRKNTLGFQGLSLPAAITSALYATAGVTSLKFQENTSASTQTINGISMVAHSVYACVQGGTDTAVAAALLENKSSGAAWNGGTSVAVIEPASGQSYTVMFDRPTPVPILIKVSIRNGATADIVQAILDYANGLIEGEPGFVVGGNVSAFEIAGAINREFPSYYVQMVQTSLTGTVNYQTTEIPIAINQIATTSATNITVVMVM